MVELIVPREVPLGGLRALQVRRTLPSRARSLIGAWCFADHFGPQTLSPDVGMVVAPHPHTGLQTLSWLFAGEVEHRDSAGHYALVRPGHVNLMTAGRGISHSEVSISAAGTLHGVQLWIALPEGHRDARPYLAHHAPELLRGPGWQVRVLVGSLLGDTSPLLVRTPLVGAELVMEAGARIPLLVEPDFEYGVLVDSGRLVVAGEPVGTHQLAYVPPGSRRIDLVALESGVRALLLGGLPFGEEIVMWWNFLGRSHEEIVAFREAWQEQITRDGELVTAGSQVRDGRFGVVTDRLPPIPAPPLPRVRLKARS